MNRLYIPLFVFLLLSISPSFAYQNFVTSPHFNSSISGLYYSTTYGISLFSTWNATCSGYTGCLMLSTNNTVYTPQQVYVVATVPAYREGIVSFRYFMNSTPQAIPEIDMYHVDSGHQYFDMSTTQISATPNRWNNYTMYLNASTVARNETILLTFYPDNVQTEIALDKFEFYTYDIQESRGTILSDFATESALYCGSNAQTQQEFLKKNTTAKAFLAYLVSNNSDDSNACCVFQWNYTVKARRCVYSTNSSAVIRVYNSRDLTFVKDESYSYFLLIHAINSQRMVYTSYTGKPNPLTIPQYLMFPTGFFQWNNGVLNTSTEQHSYHKTMNYSNSNMSGAYFFMEGVSGGTKFTGSPQSLYGETTVCDNAGWTCNAAEDYEVYTNPINCNQDELNYCSGCGCNYYNRCDLAENFMNVPSIMCNSTDPFGREYIAYVNSSICAGSIVTTAQSCPANSYCVYHSSYNGIECFDNTTGTHFNCVNSTGTVITCPSSLPSLCLSSGNWVDCRSDWFSTLALSWFGTLSRDQMITNSCLSIILAFLFAMILSIVLTYKVKKSALGVMMFVILFVAGLSIFAYLGLLNAVIWALLSVLDIMLLYKSGSG